MTSRPSASLSVTIASVASVCDHVGGIDELAVDARGECRLAQARANAARDLVHRYRGIEAALTAIGQCDNGHVETQTVIQNKRALRAYCSERPLPIW